MQFHRAQNVDNVVDGFYIPHCRLWTNFLPSHPVLQIDALHHCVEVSCLYLYTIIILKHGSNNKNIPSMSAVTVR